VARDVGESVSGNRLCPVCGAAGTVDVVGRDRLPAMQNYVYRTREAARSARAGRFTLAVCGVCDFASNRTFEPGLLEYDSGYDNSVPSRVMDAYYEQIARYLGEKFEAGRGLVVDIGCGAGTFLKKMAGCWPELRGLGFDPALPGDSTHADGRVRLVRGVFSPSLLDERPALFTCRHVIEHIPEPVAFLRQLCEVMTARGSVPLFVEVPDARWILRTGAFWDFCYEHCNYFSERSLAEVLVRAGFCPGVTRVAYGGQYRWMEAVPGPSTVKLAEPAFARALQEYRDAEAEMVRAARTRFSEIRSAGGVVALWGMATKGVIFSILVDPEGSVFDACVDVNTNKQGCFVPLTGRRIDAPAVLTGLSGRPLSIVVMNGNYLGEIRESCAAQGIRATFLDANAAEV
jgi:SAM-dependent methyltransferase